MATNLPNKCRCGKCKPCYDRDRRVKMGAGTWNYNLEVPITLTDDQEQILVGSMLGDGSLYFYKRQLNAGLAIGRATRDLEYLKYQFDTFKDFCSSGIKNREIFDKRTQKIYLNSAFRTTCSDAFTKYRKIWYPDGIRVVPPNIKLTPLVCAIWFCDDGSIVTTKSGHCISLYTDGFSLKEVENLKSELKTQINIDFRVAHKYGSDAAKGHYLTITRKKLIKSFIAYIDPAFPVSMSRKSNKWRNNDVSRMF